MVIHAGLTFKWLRCNVQALAMAFLYPILLEIGTITVEIRTAIMANLSRFTLVILLSRWLTTGFVVARILLTFVRAWRRKVASISFPEKFIFIDPGDCYVI
jgi:hypothetical protein